MTTVRDLLIDSLREIKVVSIEETPANSEIQDAFTTFVRMAQTWSTESLTIMGASASVFPLVANKYVYTIGIGGDLNITRPARIASAYLRIPNSNGIDLPIEVSTNYEKYAQITIKQVTSSYPWFLYDDNGTPLKTLTLWPIPTDSSNSLVLWVTDAISSATSINDTISLPPGYEEAIVSNLSIRLVSRYGKSASPELANWARISKAALQRVNFDVPELTVDPAISGSGGPYNIFGDFMTGQPFGGNNT